MEKLIATFNISPTNPFIVECKDGEQFSYGFIEEDFDIKINLLFMNGSPKSGFVDSELYKQLVDVVEIIVTKEVEEIPEIPINENGCRDLTQVSGFYNNIKGDYSNIAQKYYKRFIRYIKYKLKQPFHNYEYLSKDEFYNPSWSDESGNIFGTISPIVHVTRIAGMDGRILGSHTLRLEHSDEIEQELVEDINVELYQEILSDAQSAVFNDDTRRAIFEMAIVCELSAKRKYFSEGGASGLAFDYFEDKGKIKITTLELITKVANEVFDTSFKEVFPQDYENIDYLFRCRNKVAHRGNICFKDINGTLVVPDSNLVKNWFESVEVLLEWLSQN